MRKILCLLLAVLMVFSAVACNKATESSSEPSSVVADTSEESSTVDTSSGDITSEDTSSEDASSNAASSEKPTSSVDAPVSSNTSKPVSSQTSSSNSSSESSDNTLPPQLEYEAPYQGSNAAKLQNGQSSKYDSQAETLRKSILNTKDTLKGKTTYYISYKGNDNNSGTSKDAPWATIGRLDSVPVIPAGAVVLFERGGVYRGHLSLDSNVSYGAYGSGPKPCIYGSAQNYADESLWTKHNGDIWKISVPYEGVDVGNVIFDHGVECANRVINLARMSKDYDMYYTQGTVYIKLSKGNPGKIHDSIEMAGARHILSGKNVENIVIENLCIKYGGEHGIQLSTSKNITIRGCEIGYIGGSYQGGSTTRYGNGIEFWSETNGAVVEDCWVYQCYDTGITHQGSDNITQQNISFKGNLVEYCVYNIEYWVDSNEGKLKNIIYEDNILRFAGYGWFDPNNRQGSSGVAVSLICGWGFGSGDSKNTGLFNTTNFVIRNNILDTSWRYLINIRDYNTAKNATFTGNSYLQKASKEASIAVNSAQQPIKAVSATQFASEIQKIDSKAKAVDFIG